MVSDLPPLVFDSTSLLNFAAVPAAYYKLGQRYSGRARWVSAVKGELVRLANLMPPQPQATRAVNQGDWLGFPDRLEEEADLRQIEELRMRLATDGDHPRQHLGEAASVVLAKRIGGVLVTDDTDAKALAREEGLPFASTTTILAAMVRDDAMGCDEVWAAYGEMLSRDRRLPALTKDQLCSGTGPP